MNKLFEIEFNKEFNKALELLENSSKNVFILGKAGTGKSTLLNYFRNATAKKVAVLAPTGVAAVNIKGQTIHSFFRFKPNITLEAVPIISNKKKQAIYKKLDMIIIDEVSMVRADLMDCMDKFLRLNGQTADKPFGGVQIAFFGDLYQLPPVVTSTDKKIFSEYYNSPYFFSGKYFANFDMELIELEKVYRQNDNKFIEILNAIRNNTINDEQLEYLNKRVNKAFVPNSDKFYIYLVPTNSYANSINEQRLHKLAGKLYSFIGDITGDFSTGHLPTLIELNLKVGSQVMLVNNDFRGRWINGTIGKIASIDAYDKSYIEEDEYCEAEYDDEPKYASYDVIKVQLETGKIIKVRPYQWELYKFILEDGQIKSETIGTFTQYPLKLSWAITIHKSQGKTFNNAIIDLGKSVFSTGQTYVALSRCTSLQGMVLFNPIMHKHIWIDYKIVKFITDYQYEKAEISCSSSQKRQILNQAIAQELTIDMVYLQANDVKSKRKIIPLKIEQMEYKDKPFEGLQAYCCMRQDERIFKIDRILELTMV